MALAAYRGDRGRYPARLEQLTPEYLKAVPKDLPGDGPLHYRPSSDAYLLYSVGVNGKDDGAKGYDDREKAGRWGENDWDDLSVRLPAEKQEKKPEERKQ